MRIYSLLLRLRYKGADVTMTYPIEQLVEFSRRIFLKYGVSASDASLAADVLAASDLRGIDSHGIARLTMYAKYLADGSMNPQPNISVVRETPSTACVDGDRGLGLIVGPKANALAMEKATNVGSGWVSVRNSTHFGIAGYYPLQALSREMIGWAMTNGTCWMAPIWGAQRRLGTNPLAIAFPGLEEPPVVIDMATTAVAYGKIQLARRQHQALPIGWALDAKGQPTTDPDEVDDNGSLLPLGSDRERGGHKGYCLSAMVDILSGMLSGANWGPFVPPFVLTEFNTPEKQVGKGIGHFFGAMRIDGFCDPDSFKTRIDAWVRTMRATKPAEGTSGPLVPGDPERLALEHRKRDGVPLVRTVVESLQRLSSDTGVPFD